MRAYGVNCVAFCVLHNIPGPSVFTLAWEEKCDSDHPQALIFGYQRRSSGLFVPSLFLLLQRNRTFTNCLTPVRRLGTQPSRPCGAISGLAAAVKDSDIRVPSRSWP